MEVPQLERVEILSGALDLVRTLYDDCRGNLVRVGEKLAEQGIDAGYSTLTAFCRRHEIGTTPKQVAGAYHFEPGEEMQHDTSPHVVVIAGSSVTVQCASLVMCYSRDLYAQVYPRWSRFECRIFMSEAVSHFGGAAHRCMIDNSSVVIAHGSGKNAVPAAEMQAMERRFGFKFVAHAPGDANRSARVERPFDYIDNNFYAGRTFDSVDDLNAQLRAWCEKVRNMPKRRLPRTPAELFAAEKPSLVPLPLHVPEVYEVHQRRVGVEGYVQLHTTATPHQTDCSTTWFRCTKQRKPCAFLTGTSWSSSTKSSPTGPTSECCRCPGNTGAVCASRRCRPRMRNRCCVGSIPLSLAWSTRSESATEGRRSRL